MVHDPDKTDPLQATFQVDRLCDEFEDRLIEGDAPQIESFLKTYNGPDTRSLFVALLKVELEYRSRKESLNRQDYKQRFDEHSLLVDQVFDEMSHRLPLDETYVAGQEKSKTVPAGKTDAPSETGKAFGPYLLLSEIARGGMGIVYRARQKYADRIVALKVIRSGGLADQEERQRFLNEARAAAALSHPAIVPVFDVGEVNGDPYFSMELIDGESLADQIKKGPLSSREAVSVLLEATRGIQHAHREKIVHRDLKPANILISKSGQTLVTDFGLAKSIEIDSQLTATGQVLGTPSFMAPEQAVGGAADHRADVYSLGATLYALITGRPPFQASTLIETLQQLAEREPLAPQTLNPEVDRDLNTICLKCLEKSPDKRYPTAAALAADLQCWLEGSPISARPISTTERCLKWCRKNPVVSTLIGAIALLLVVGLTVSISLALYAQSQATDALTQKSKFEFQYKEADRQRQIVSKQREEVLHQKTIVEQERDEANRRRIIAEKLLHFGQISDALRHWEQHDGPRALSALAETDPAYRGWEYRFLRSNFSTAGEPFDVAGHAIQQLACSFDGNYLCCVGFTGILFRKSRSGEVINENSATGVRCVDGSPSDLRVVTGNDDGCCRLWDFRTGKLIKASKPVGSPIGRLEYGKSGKRVVGLTQSGSVVVFKIPSMETEKRFDVTTSPYPTDEKMPGLTVDADERYVAVRRSERGTVHLWNLETSQRHLPLSVEKLGMRVNCMRFHPNQPILSMYGLRQDYRSTETIVHVDPATGQKIAEIGLQPGQPNPGMATVMRYNADGKRILVGHNGAVSLWQYEKGMLGYFLGHPSIVESVRFVPRQPRFVSAGYQSMKNWDLFAFAGDRRLLVGPHFARTLVISSDGDELYLGTDHLGTVYELPTRKVRFQFRLEPETTRWKKRRQAILHPGKNALVISQKNRLEFRDLDSGEIHNLITLEKPDSTKADEANTIDDFAIDRLGETIILSTRSGDVWITDKSGKAKRIHTCADEFVAPVAVHPSGDLVAFGDQFKTFVFNRTDNDRFDVLSRAGRTAALLFIPGTNHLVKASQRNEIVVVDTSTEKVIRELKSDQSLFNCKLGIHPSGRLMVFSQDKLQFWDLTTGKRTIEHELESGVFATHPDGTRIYYRDQPNYAILVLDGAGDHWYRRDQFFQSSKIEPQQDHRYRAFLAEGMEDWFAARFHLDALLKKTPEDKELLRRRAQAQTQLESTSQNTHKSR